MSAGHRLLGQPRGGSCDTEGQGWAPGLGTALFGGEFPPESRGLIPSPGSRPSWPLHSHRACPGPWLPCSTHIQAAGWPGPGDSRLWSARGAEQPASSDWDVRSVGLWGEQWSVSAGRPRHSGSVCVQWARGDTERPLVTQCPLPSDPVHSYSTHVCTDTACRN